MATSTDEITRISVGSSEHVPAGTLKQMLTIETDPDVLKVLLMNPRTPLKAIMTFVDDARADIFEDDNEISNWLMIRVGNGEETETEAE